MNVTTPEERFWRRQLERMTTHDNAEQPKKKSPAVNRGLQKQRQRRKVKNSIAAASRKRNRGG